MCGIAGVFAGFQALMPLAGWFCVCQIARYFQVFERFIPWIALILLVFIGGKMLVGGIRNRGSVESRPALGLGALLVQGVATSIDALSVGSGRGHIHRRAVCRFHHCGLWLGHGSCGRPYHLCRYLYYMYGGSGDREAVRDEAVGQSADFGRCDTDRHWR